MHTTLLRRSAVTAALGLSLGFLPAGPAQAETYVPCNDIQALRNAIVQANANGQLITLAPLCTYTLTAPFIGEDGLPSITGNVRLVSTLTTIRRADNAGADFRVFHVLPGGHLRLTSVNVAGGRASSGGGIYNQGGTLTVTSAAIHDNHSTGSGGGVRNTGTLTLTNTTVRDNGAGLYGGGVINSGTMRMVGGSLRNNTSTSFGGGLENWPGGRATVNTAAVIGNSSAYGGGIDNDGASTLNLITVTVNNNRARYGGGISNFNGSTATLVSSRVANNTATAGVGAGGGIFNPSGTVNLRVAAVIGNTPENCAPPNSVPGCINPAAAAQTLKAPAFSPIEKKEE